MSEYDDISVVIPVREGSSRVKNKIFLPFGEGVNLTEWKVQQLLKVQDKSRIFLSSNSDNVKEIADRMGVQYLERDDYLSTGHDASFSEVITGIVKRIPTNHFAWVTVVVPLMSPSEYREAFDIYLNKVIENKHHDSLVSVNLVRDYLWDERGALNYEATKNHTISQDLPSLYRVTNGLYMRDKETALKEGYFLGSNPFKHEVKKISGVDIDYDEDYRMALALKSFYVD